MGKGRAGGKEPLLPSKAAALERIVSYKNDELHSFRSCLRWMCIDQSDAWRATISWSLFFLLAIVVPILSHLIIPSSKHRRSYDLVVQLSLTAASSIAFICLSSSLRHYGLRRFLFLHQMHCQSDKVRYGYTAQLNRSFRILSSFVMPCFLAEFGYKVWWYYTMAPEIPFLENELASDSVVCILELASWMYRTTIFFLACVLFRVICHLQILSLQDFTTLFHQEVEVEVVLKEHLRLRRQLMVISHRFRKLIIVELIIVTTSQLASLLLTTRPHADVNLMDTGELALCSVVLVTGLLICLGSAAKITHKAQSLAGHAAKWHVCATIESFTADPETPYADINSECIFPVDNDNNGQSDEEDIGDEDELEGTKLVQPRATTISFQNRQALVTYLENNGAGITVFGFVLDRGYLHNICMVELSLVSWLLGKTIGIS